ncbi:MAG: hypothetical protein PHD02_02050 [Bacilli bacterium]|nr:hypothetical protein [Bacilli bacterium]
MQNINLKDNKKIALIILVIVFILFNIGTNTFARFKNRTSIVSVVEWDGTVATSYKDGDGSENDPYVISNGSELAYFSLNLETNNYSNTYFVLSSDIALNEGSFVYNEGYLEYILDGTTYYVDLSSNNYYLESDFSGNVIGSLNIINPLDNFDGYFDGKSFSVYGFYLNNLEYAGLFTNLIGSVSNLYVENAFINGGRVSGGVVSNATGASISNVLFNGYVVGESILSNTTLNFDISVSDINLSSTLTETVIDLSNNESFLNSEIVSTSISGDYIINNSTEENTTITINGEAVTGGSFNIDLGTSILDNVSCITMGEEGASITFSNVQYNVVYKYSVAGGIIGYSEGSILNNVVNKGSIYGYSVSGGVIGVATDSLVLNRSYNMGEADSYYSSGGVIGNVDKLNSSDFYNIYNIGSGSLGSIIANINDSTLAINDSFNPLNTYSIYSINNSNVSISNVYILTSSSFAYSGSVTGTPIETTITNFYDETYMNNNVNFDSFISFDDLSTNNSNVWVYEADSFPILYLDDINNPIANLNANVYSWNNLSFDLNPIKLNTNITFNIEGVSELKPIKESYYYISNYSTPLTQVEIDNISWTSYSDIVQITSEGTYVIYVKIVDYDDEVTYINSDLLILDLTGSVINISLDNEEWNSKTEDLSYYYINQSKDITVSAIDDLSGVDTVEYYITDSILTSGELDLLDTGLWNTYDNGISIDTEGKYIVYVKVIDNVGYITYVNSDFIVYDGYYEDSIIVGKNEDNYSGHLPIVTDKSSLTFNFSYSAESYEMVNPVHKIKSSMLLPIGTKLTLIDNINSKTYIYTIGTSEDIYGYGTSCAGLDNCSLEATYLLSTFYQVGTNSSVKNYVDDSYYSLGSIVEDFTINVDFSNTSIDSNLENEYIYLSVSDDESLNDRKTLLSNIKYYNVYYLVNELSTKATLSLSSEYSDTIYLNNEGIENIDIESSLDYTLIDYNDIVDTTYEDKYNCLLIKLVDSEGTIVTKDNLQNVKFKVGETEYYISDDDMFHVVLDDSFELGDYILSMIKYNGNGTLENGDYYLKIQNYASYDGISYDDIGSDVVTIPVIVSNNEYLTNYAFDVIMSTNILYKEDVSSTIHFDVLQNGDLESPSIKVSMYRKTNLTAYNQDYSVVNLQTYTSNGLIYYIDNVYTIFASPISYTGYNDSYNLLDLVMLNDLLDNTGYKFVFDLYDGDEKVGTISKYFIVR